jgi:hypothetical protein
MLIVAPGFAMLLLRVLRIGQMLSTGDSKINELIEYGKGLAASSST